MTDLKKLQKEIYQNKVNKGFNITDINKEFCLTYGEVAEAYEAWRKKKDDLGEELADVAIYLLGLSEILNIDLEDEIDSDQDKTVAIADINYSEDDDDRTIMAEGKEEKRYFVTGWLVCVDGAEKGRDYRLHMGFNRIGRSYQMDICLEDDLAITRDNHCSVIYDDKNGQFLVKPSVGTVTYLNGNILLSAEIIKTGDRIRVGQSTLELVAFCNGEKKW